jgi:DNA-binding response OmpR family regulator
LTERKKILLVDDSATVLLFEKMVLAKEPYDLVVAKDGQEGLEKALEVRPHLILMDVMMPRMDGVEACRRIRAQGEIARTPVILVTTRGEPESVASGKAAGCSDYLTKPINSGELLTKIRKHLAA